MERRVLELEVEAGRTADAVLSRMRTPDEAAESSAEKVTGHRLDTPGSRGDRALSPDPPRDRGRPDMKVAEFRDTPGVKPGGLAGEHAAQVRVDRPSPRDQ